jgi:hypothetical protein
MGMTGLIFPLFPTIFRQKAAIDIRELLMCIRAVESSVLPNGASIYTMATRMSARRSFRPAALPPSHRGSCMVLGGWYWE